MTAFTMKEEVVRPRPKPITLTENLPINLRQNPIKIGVAVWEELSNKHTCKPTETHLEVISKDVQDGVCMTAAAFFWREQKRFVWRKQTIEDAVKICRRYSKSRQEWPIRLCDPVNCTETSYVDDEEEKVLDPCDEDDDDKKEEEGPLDRFDKSMKENMNMDIWGREPPRNKQQSQPAILARTTANTLETTEDLATEDYNNRSFAKRLAAIEKHFLFEQALMVAEQAADAAPPELVEEAALASARGYTMTLETERKPIATEGETIIEVISYLGITKPLDDYTPDCSA